MSFETDVPRSARRLAGKKVTAVGDFELKWEFSFVAPSRNSTTVLDTISREKALALLAQVEAAGFRHMTSDAGESVLMSYHIRLRRGNYTHEVSWSARAPQADELMGLYMTILNVAKG